MNITAEQLECIRKGQVVRVSTDSGVVVLLNAEVYDRVASVLADDPRGTYQSVLSAWDSEGSADDAMLYQDLA